MEPERGRLLVASPVMGDPNFARTVVLLLQHGEQGAMGVVLNRPGDVPVARVLPGWADEAEDDSTLFLGGPVQTDALVALGRGEEPELHGADAPVLPGLVVLDLRHRRPARAVRVFHGYAGWGAGQLEDEVDAGGWIVCPATPDDPFIDDPRRLWHAVLARRGGLWRVAVEDPSVN